VADHIDAAQPFRHHGFFTAKAWMQHHLQLSGAEAYGRVQEAKLRRVARVWNDAVAGGQVGVAQSRLMARIAANPRIPGDLLVAGVWELMVDAMDCSYVEFERRALTFEALADPVGAAEKAERIHQRRAASLHQHPSGAWTFHADLDEVGGPEFLEIFSWYTDREFDRDWAEAKERLGDGNVDVSLWAMIRRVVTDAKGVVIDLGRTQRLFSGYARAAVMLLEPTCIWPGCDQPHSWCHADHLTSWSTRGPTNADNGAPLCARHNPLEEQGFTVSRGSDGHWHITAPDGTDLC
jgi:hypothetical protein